MKTALLAIVLAFAFAACHDDPPPCYVGDYRACACANGATGYAACLPTQDGFGPCPCDGKTPTFDAGAEDGGP